MCLICWYRRSILHSSLLEYFAPVILTRKTSHSWKSSIYTPYCTRLIFPVRGLKLSEEISAQSSIRRILNFFLSGTPSRLCNFLLATTKSFKFMLAQNNWYSFWRSLFLEYQTSAWDRRSWQRFVSTPWFFFQKFFLSLRSVARQTDFDSLRKRNGKKKRQ